MGHLENPTYDLLEMWLDETFEVSSDLSWDDIWAKTFDFITSFTESNELYKTLEPFRGDIRTAVYNSLWEELWIMWNQEIIKISRSGPYIMFDLKDGRKLIYDIFKYSQHPEANTIFRGDYNEQLHETQQRWDKFYDYTLAMDAIFEVQWRRLNEEDVFTTDMIGKVINPDTAEKLVGKSIEEIQLLARESLKELNEYIWKVPYDLFTPDFKNAIAIAQDRYIRMVMWIWHNYRWGATLFENKTQAEVENSISFMLYHQGSVSEVFAYWHSIRNDIDANNDQDTTVEQKSYPLFMQLLNNFSYVRLQQLWASKEELHRFARNIAGYDLNWGLYGENHYDYETSQMIIASLLWTPSTERVWENERWSESVFDKLIRCQLINVTDSHIENPENLDSIIKITKEKCTTYWFSYPDFINTTFLWWRDISIFTWKSYQSLNLWDKFSISSVVRFIEKIWFSNWEYPHQYSEDSQNYWDMYFCSSIARATNYLNYNRETPSVFTIKLPHRNSIWNKAILNIPRELIQSASGARFYITRLQNILDDENIYFDWNEGIFLNEDEEDTVNTNEIIQSLWVYKEDSNEVSRLIEESISESLEDLTSNIEAHFDSWDWDSSENSSINPDDLRNKYDECGILFSEIDIEILKTWMDMRWLWESFFEWSDTSQGYALTWLKIAIVMAIAIAATSLTAWLAWGAGLTTVAWLLRWWRLVQQWTRTIVEWTIRWQIIQWWAMWFYAAPASWLVYPKWYTSDGEMITDLGTDMLVSTITWVFWWYLWGKFHQNWSHLRNSFITWTDIWVLGLYTETKRMQAVDSYYHWENLFQETE